MKWYYGKVVYSSITMTSPKYSNMNAYLISRNLTLQTVSYKVSSDDFHGIYKTPFTSLQGPCD